MPEAIAMGKQKQKTLWMRLIRPIKRQRHGLNRFIARYSLVGNPPVFDPAVFTWTADLEENWRAIRDEAAALMSGPDEIPTLSDFSPDHQRLDQKRRWQIFFLWGYGYRADGNAKLAPHTAALVDRIPGLVTALYSIHKPGAHLPRHRGVTKGMITCHLGLIIPDDPAKCRIAVEDRDYHWTPGRFFIFDDTYHHEVWNDTDEERVILLIHVRRPLRGIGRWVESFFFNLIRLSPFVQRARKNLGEK